MFLLELRSTTKVTAVTKPTDYLHLLQHAWDLFPGSDVEITFTEEETIHLDVNGHRFTFEIGSDDDAYTGVPLSSDDIAAMLANLGRAPLGLDVDLDREFRISIAGAQEKTALLLHEGQWLRPHGVTPTTHILKPQIGRLPNGVDLSNSVENEFYCMTLAGAFGLPAANCEMQTFGSTKALVVERFDRRWTRGGRLIRLPQEDCCQALGVPPTQKYQNQGGPGIAAIMDLLKASDDPTVDRLTFFKSQVVFWLIGATDGHAKNFSLALGPKGLFRLTPLYDVLTVQPTFDQRHIGHNAFKLSMSVGNSPHGAGSRRRPSVPLGGDHIHRREDRLLGSHAARVGEEGRGEQRQTSRRAHRCG